MTHAALRALVSCLALSAAGALAGCSAGPQDFAYDSAAEVNGSNAEKTAYNFFISKGLTSDQAAGVVGNLMQESSVSLTSLQYGGGPGRGIAQWSVGGRWDHDHNDNLIAYASGHGASPWALTTQLDFIWYELQTFSGYGLAKLEAAGDVSSATVAFQDLFEGCGTCAQSTRISYAKQVLALYGNGGGGGNNGNNPAPASCKSGTLGRSVPNDACVESKFDKLWYQCDNGSWVDRWSSPTPCSELHPL